jgi:hypothetical protein
MPAKQSQEARLDPMRLEPIHDVARNLQSPLSRVEIERISTNWRIASLGAVAGLVALGTLRRFWRYRGGRVIG